MSENADKSRALKIGDVSIPLICGDSIPLVYFELIASASYLPGMVEIVLATGALLPNADGTATERVANVTGLLKCNIIAAQSLRDALVQALAILEKPTDPLQSN